MLNKIKTLSGSLGRGKNPDSKSGNQYIVGLDIGTEYVKALVGKVITSTPTNPTQTQIEIVGVGRAHQQLSDMQAGAISDISAVVRNCNDALVLAEQEANVSVKNAVIGIAGELVKGTTATVRCNRKDSNKPMDEAEVNQIIGLVQERAEAKARAALAWELGGKEVDVRIVNSALVNIAIDGYNVTNPVGFQGKDVVVQLYTAFAPMIHIGALERTAQELDLDLIAVAAEPFAVARSVVGDDAGSSMSAILMDIGGGTTDIAVINEGGVQGTKMFGIGGRAFTRGIERDLNVSFDTAEGLKLGLSTNKTPAQRVADVENSLRKTLEVWLSGVELALAEFDKLDHLPHHMLLCGGGSSLDMLVEILGETSWYSELPFARRPIVQLIQPEQVVGMVDKTGQVNDHTFITAMGLLRVGLDTQAQNGDVTPKSFRARIDKLLRT